MRGKIVLAGLILSLSGVAARAQEKAAVPIPEDIYCSGMVTTESVPRGTYIITGQESSHRITYSDGDYVYINKGADQGARVGDVFTVMRPVQDTIQIEWTKWQNSILRKMGTVWEDEGRARVVVTQPNVSIARVQNVCDYLQRGDIALPFTERPVPALKSEKNFDRFAPASGKALAMVITGKKFQQQDGTNDIVYVNLGSSQGVKPGDYFRIFRYTGTQHGTVYETNRIAFDAEQMGLPKFGYAGYTGFGKVPAKWKWSNTPREVLGEGVVLRTGPNSSTVVITLSLREIYSGDYVELE